MAGNQTEERVDRAMIFQAWRSVAFLHWPVAPEVVATRLPEGLEPDTVEGSAWLGLHAVPGRAVRRARPARRSGGDVVQRDQRPHLRARARRAGRHLVLLVGRRQPRERRRWTDGRPAVLPVGQVGAAARPRALPVPAAARWSGRTTTSRSIPVDRCRTTASSRTCSPAVGAPTTSWGLGWWRCPSSTSPGRYGMRSSSRATSRCWFAPASIRAANRPWCTSPPASTPGSGHPA
jgi:hypothetical protein